MPDIFDQLAPERSQASGDIFDQITAPTAKNGPTPDIAKLPLAPYRIPGELAPQGAPVDTSNPLTPIQSMRQGEWEQYPGVQDINRGADQIANPTQPGDQLRGAAHLAAGGFKVISPVLAVLGATAPLEAAAWYAISKGTGMLAEEGAKKLGADKEDAQLTDDLAQAAPLLYGAYRIGEGKFSDAIDAHNTRVDEVLAKEKAQGRRMAENAGRIVQGEQIGEWITGPNGIRVGPDGWRIVGNGASGKRISYGVVDTDGKQLFAGDRGGVENFLERNGIEKTPVLEQVKAAIVEQVKQQVKQNKAKIDNAKKLAALEFIRQNPDTKIGEVQRQFGLGYGTVKKLTDFAAAERAAASSSPAEPPAEPPAEQDSVPSATPAADPSLSPTPASSALPGNPPTVAASPIPTSSSPAGPSVTAPEPIATKTPGHYAQPGALSDTGLAAPPAPESPAAETKSPVQSSVQISDKSPVQTSSSLESTDYTVSSPSDGDVFDAIAPAQTQGGDVFDALATQSGEKARTPAEASGIQSDEAKPSAERSPEDRVLAAMREIRKTWQADQTMRSIRAAVPDLAKADFDRAIHALAEQQRIELSTADYSASHLEDDPDLRDQLVPSLTDRGRYYVAAHLTEDADASGIRSDEAKESPERSPQSSNLPHPKMPALVDALGDRIASGPAIKDTPALVKLASEVLGDPLTSGKYDIKDLYDALETAVNRHIANDERIMKAEPREALAGLQHFLSALPTQTARTKEQKQFQQFSTPPTLSYLAVKAADVRPGETVLEPSAGTGSLAAFAKAAGAEVETNELSPSRAAFLELLGFKPTSVNAERIRDHRPDLQPDVVVMNPPFSATAGRTSTNKNSVGYQHVLSALDMLPAGGRLVAILGRGASFDHPTALPFFESIKKRGAAVRANIGLDGSNYAKYGTTFDNRLIIVDKIPDAGKPVTGDFKDLAEAFDALRPVIDSRPASSRNAEAGTSHDLEQRPDSGSAVTEGRLPEGQGRNGKRGSGRGRSGQSDVHVEPAGPGGDVDPTTRPELSTGPVDAITPSPADHTGDHQPSERHEPLADVKQLVKLKTRDRSDEKVERQGTYQLYRPAKLATGVSHQQATGTGLVETGAMASVEPPDISYHPQLPASIIKNGHVTDAQLESVAYAGQAHAQMLPNGKRAGFMIGDGTGVGKGTEAAAIALDNWNQGRRKTLWLSLKPGLIQQAQRDLDWVEAPIKAKMLNDYDFSEDITHQGVIFATYSMLHRVAAKQGGGSRLDQLIKWNPDVILMDESHAAKNAVATGQDEGEESPLRGTATKAGQAVLDLDEKLPDSRFTYMSATAFTDTRNLGYASRLGLWGDGTSFPEGFKDFNVQIDRGGYGAMELVAKEMKAMGRYVARQISFEGVSFKEVTAHLSAGQREMYDSAVNAWQQIFRNIDKAIEATTGADEKRAKGLQRMRAVSQFWSTNQRFYRNLITAMKIPAVIAEIEAALEKKHSVFIDLVSTGEAEAQRQLVKAAEENLSFDELDMSAKAMILNFLDNSFPTQVFEEYEDENKQKRTRTVVDEKGNPVHSQEAIALREAIKRDLEKIQLPQAPMDQIIDYFGPDAVAEVSGRKSRIVQDQKTGRPLEVQRVKPKGASAKDVNDWERQNFQSGKKRIAIASGAGGTGFDFHSDKRNANQQRRTHIVLEPSWSADQQMQKFGRTHRTNQANAPEYILIASDLGGEKRFISAIAARIASLGALTRGERKAGGGAAEMLAKYNLEGKYGDAAKQAFFTGLAGGRAVLQDDVTVNIAKPPTELEELGAMDVCRLLGVVIEGEQGPRVNVPTLKQFLNRMLNLPTSIQAAAFNYFMDHFERIISTVKEAGAFDEGTQELKALTARITNREVLRTAENGTPTNHITVQAELPAEKNDWETAVHHVNQGDRSDYNQTQHAGLYRNLRSGKVWMARKSTKDITDQASGAVLPAMSMIGPQAGSRQTVPVATLTDRTKFERIQNYAAQKTWQAALAEIPDTYSEDVHLINGSVLPVWRQLGASGDDYRMNVVSIPTENGGQITGIRIPAEQISTLRDSLGGGGMSSPSMILNRIWRQGERIPLRDAQLGVSRVMGEKAIVVQPSKPSGREILERLGLAHLETASSVRYYLPYSDNATAEQTQETVAKLTQILEAFPPKMEETKLGLEDENAGERGSLSIDPAIVAHLQKLFKGEDGEPRRDYSFLGAGKSMFVRNLSQIEAVSETAHKALVRAASSKAQAAALIRGAWPKVVKALGKDTTDAEFRAGLIESRLLGTEQRWRDLAAATQSVPKDDLVDWVLGGPIQLLASMSEDGDLAQQAAALAGNITLLPKSKLNRNAHERLRMLVAGSFEEAADSVHHMMTRDEFNELTNRPGFEKGLETYHREIEPELAENHSLNEGVFSDSLGPLETYYPLVPIRAADEASRITGARRGFKKPGNIANRFTTGLADDYDASMEAFADRVGAALRINDKAGAIEELINAGILRKLKQGESADVIHFRGQEYKARIVPMGPARTIVEGGKVIHIPEQRAAIAEPFYHEIKPILEPDAKLPPGLISKFLHTLAQITLSGPADMVFHSHNLLGALVANTPFLSDDLATKTIGNTPFTKVFTAITKLATVDPMDDAAVSDLQEMAKLGLLPERFGQETYSKRYAEQTGAKLKSPWKLQFSPMLYGPKGIDVRARLIMYRLAKAINPTASSVEIYKFVNQLGNYTEALQGHLERSLKSTGLSPFYTAGSTMLRNGVDAWLGTGSGSGPGGGKGNRLAQQLSAGAIGIVAAWILTYKAMTGKWPWEDARAKLLKIPAADWMRKSRVGIALWGPDTRKVGYLNFGFTSPMVSRGARAIGVQGATDTALEGGNWRQVTQGAKRDIVNTAIHPVAGPPVRIGMMMTTGKEPYLVSDREGGSKFLSGVPKKAPIGSEALYAARELNSFYGNVGAAAGFQGPHDAGGSFADHILRAIIEMAGITSPATNPYATRKALADERRAHR